MIRENTFFLLKKGKKREEKFLKRNFRKERGKREGKRKKKDLVHFEQGPNFLLYFPTFSYASRIKIFAP